MVDQALGTIGHWIAWLLAFVFGLFAVVEDAVRRLMDQLHIAAGMQTVILVLLTVALIILAIRVFGGIFRILLMAFLVLLLIHVVLHQGRI
jgi:hypothetical protein